MHQNRFNECIWYVWERWVEPACICTMYRQEWSWNEKAASRTKISNLMAAMMQGIELRQGWEKNGRKMYDKTSRGYWRSKNKSTRAPSLLILIVHPYNLYTSGHSTVPSTGILWPTCRIVPKLWCIQDLFYDLLEGLSHTNRGLRRCLDEEGRHPCGEPLCFGCWHLPRELLSFFRDGN